MQPLKKQTTQRERLRPRAVAGGAGTISGVSIVLAMAEAFGWQIDPALAAAIGSLLTVVAGLVVSRLGK